MFMTLVDRGQFDNRIRDSQRKNDVGSEPIGLLVGHDRVSEPPWVP
jgi:hypothetical protein